MSIPVFKHILCLQRVPQMSMPVEAVINTNKNGIKKVEIILYKGNLNIY